MLSQIAKSRIINSIYLTENIFPKKSIALLNRPIESPTFDQACELNGKNIGYKRVALRGEDVFHYAEKEPVISNRVEIEFNHNDGEDNWDTIVGLAIISDDIVVTEIELNNSIIIKPNQKFLINKGLLTIKF